MDEESLDDILINRILEKTESERTEGTEYRYQENRELALPPYYLLVQENGYLKAQVDIFKDQINELKNRVKLLEEKLTYQKTSCIKRLFKR